MKKLLLLAASTAVLSTSAMADTNSKFYLRGDLGYNKLVDWKMDVNLIGFGSLKFKENKRGALNFDFGAGYNLTDKIRTELVYSHYLPNQYIYTKSVYGIMNESASLEHKSSIDSIMLKGYVDVMELNKDNKIFVGAGVGAARTKETFVLKANTLGYTLNYKDSQKKTNFAYSLAFGFASKVSASITAEVQYNFSDLGQSNVPKVDNVVLGKKISYRSHGIKVGLRVDI